MALRGLHPTLRPYAEYALSVAHANGLRPVVTSVRRTYAEQTALRRKFEQCVAQGRFRKTPDCRYPAARPGYSAHNYGLAWDSFVPAPQMALWRTIREWIGWQVPDGDVIHSQLPQWRSHVSPPPEGWN